MEKKTFLRFATEKETEKFSFLARTKTALDIAFEKCTNADAIKGIIDTQIQFMKEYDQMWKKISKPLGHESANITFNRKTNELFLVEYFCDECEDKNE